MVDLEAIDAGLGSPNEDTRWQAAIALGEQCEDAPEVIWPLTVKWGSCDNEDMRTAIATCVLEHILECHFDEYFPKTAVLIYGGNHQFADTFRGCWKFGNADIASNNRQWDDLDAFTVAIAAAKLKIVHTKTVYKQRRRTRQL